MRKAIFCLAVFLASSWVNAAFAADQYNFVSEYIRELGAIEKIRADAEKDLNTADANPFVGCIRSSTQNLLELRASIGMLKTYKLQAVAGDPIPDIVEFDEQKIALYQQLSGICSQLIAGPKPNVDYGQLAAEAPKITATLDYIDHSLFNVAPLVFSALIDPKPDAQGHMSRLVITKEQRATLVERLNATFGKKMDQDDQTWTVSAASVLKTYLQKDYSTADE